MPLVLRMQIVGFPMRHFIFILLYIIQDLKDPRRRDDLAASRAVLKKSSMMLLTASKVSFFFSQINKCTTINIA